MSIDEREKWRLERLARKITLTEIAKHLNRSIGYVCHHENSRNTLTSELYADYCNYILKHDNRNK